MESIFERMQKRAAAQSAFEAEQSPAVIGSAPEFDPTVEMPEPVKPLPAQDFVPGRGPNVGLAVIGKGTIDQHVGHLSEMFGAAPKHMLHVAGVHHSIFHFDVSRRSSLIAKKHLEDLGYAVEFLPAA